MEPKSVVTLSMEGDMHTNWKLFKRKLMSCIDAYFEKAEDKQKIGILLHHGGDYCQDVYETFDCKPEDKFNTIIEKFDAHFIPKINITYERYKIFTLKQSNDETFEQYVTALKRISQGCKFGTLQDELVRDLFICGINNPNLKRQLLGMSDLTLEKALAVCKNFAIVEGQITQIEKVSECSVKKEVEIDMIKKKSLENMSKSECQYCGYKHEYGRCPAFGKVCAICKKKNHYARKCMTKKVNLLEHTNNDDNSDEYEVAILSLDNAMNKMKRSWYCATLRFNNSDFQLKVDSGAQCNVVSEKQFKQLGVCESELKETNVRITSFTNGKVPVIGKCTLSCEYKCPAP